MNDLLKLQAEMIKALQSRNKYLENELKQAKDLFQSLINEWEVVDAEFLDFPNLDCNKKNTDNVYK